MGKATILDGGTDGHYTIRREYDQRYYDRQKIILAEKISGLTDSIAALEVQKVDLQAKLDAASAASEAAIDAYISASTSGGPPPKAELDAFKAAMEVSKKAAGDVRIVNWRISLQKADKLGAEKRIELLDSAIALESEPAWCADYTETASGEVATIEINGEDVQSLIIKPQSDDGAESPGHNPETDGTLCPREWMSPEQAYFNAAILPGWQRHDPTYRAGTITAIDTVADTCSVTLSGATSSAQGLDINAATDLHDVPVRYMTCNATAFEVGDIVVVELDDRSWETPVVIGFVSEPRPCSMFYMAGTVDAYAPGTTDIVPWRIVAKISPATREVKKSWAYPLGLNPFYELDGVFGHKGAPYGYVSVTAGYTDTALINNKIIFGRDASEQISLFEKSFAHRSYGNEFYGIDTDTQREVSAFSTGYLTTSGATDIMPLRTFTACSETEYLYALAAHSGLIVVGGAGSGPSGYFARVFTTAGSTVGTIYAYGVIKDVAIGKDLILVLSFSSDWRIEIFSRSTLAAITSITLTIQPDQIAIAGDVIMASGNALASWNANFWRINPDNSTTHLAETQPLSAALMMAGGATSGMSATSFAGVGDG